MKLNPLTRTKRVLTSALSNIDEEKLKLLPKRKTLQRFVNRNKSANLPKIPKARALKDINVRMLKTLQTESNEDMLYFDNQKEDKSRWMIFATHKNLHRLIKCRVISVDATYKVSFAQLIQIVFLGKPPSV